MSNKITTDLLEFIENSPSCFHAVQTTKEILTKHGFTELSEDQTWNLTPGNDYFVTRNGSSIIAFSIPESVVLQMDSVSLQATVIRLPLRSKKIRRWP